MDDFISYLEINNDRRFLNIKQIIIVKLLPSFI